MLYDKKWDVASLESFIAWLETKDPDEGYAWAGCTPCLMEQYGAAKGVNVFEPTIGNDLSTNIYHLVSINNGAIALRANNFGEALALARKALARKAEVV